MTKPAMLPRQYSPRLKKLPTPAQRRDNLARQLAGGDKKLQRRLRYLPLMNVAVDGHDALE